MKNLFVLIIAFLTFAAASVQAQETTYRYEGANYTSVSFVAPCPVGVNCQEYTTSMRLSGTLTLSEPLQPNITNVDVTSRIVRFNFTDGINTFSSSSPGSGVNNLTVSTDSAGKIQVTPSNFYFLAYRFLDGNMQVNVGERLSVIQIGAAQNNNGMLQDSLNNGECNSVNSNGGCASVLINSQGSSYASVNDGGTWSTVSTSAIPTLGEWAMIFMASMMAIIGFMRMHSSRT